MNQFGSFRNHLAALTVGGGGGDIDSTFCVVCSNVVWAHTHHHTQTLSLPPLPLPGKKMQQFVTGARKKNSKRKKKAVLPEDD